MHNAALVADMLQALIEEAHKADDPTRCGFGAGSGSPIGVKQTGGESVAAGNGVGDASVVGFRAKSSAASGSVATEARRTAPKGQDATSNAKDLKDKLDMM